MAREESRLPAEQAGGTAFVASSSSDGASASARPHPATEAPYKEGYRAGPLGTQQRNEYLHERGKEFELRNKDWCIRLRRRCRICGGARGAAVCVLDYRGGDPEQGNRRDVFTTIPGVNCGRRQRRHRLRQPRATLAATRRSRSPPLMVPRRRSRTRRPPRMARASPVVRPTAATAEGACDVDVSNQTGSGVTVALKIDDDSAVRHRLRQPDRDHRYRPHEDTESIKITVKQVPTSLTVKADTSSIDAKGENAVLAGTTYVDIRLTDASNEGIGIAARISRSFRPGLCWRRWRQPGRRAHCSATCGHGQSARRSALGRVHRRLARRHRHDDARMLASTRGTDGRQPSTRAATPASW